MITPDASKYLPQIGLSPKRRNCDSSGFPLLLFRADDFRNLNGLNPSDNIENYHEEVHTLRCSCNSV